MNLLLIGILLLALLYAGSKRIYAYYLFLTSQRPPNATRYHVMYGIGIVSDLLLLLIGLDFVFNFTSGGLLRSTILFIALVLGCIAVFMQTKKQ
ncbi:MAG: hypothetical protein ACRC5C_02935 [Bacilli bacterium]